MKRSLKTAERIAELLDNRFEILGIRFGIDPLLGLLPGIGDLVPIFFSVYLITIAKKWNIPQKDINRMIIYLLLDWAIGIIPIIGDMLDFFYKSNIKILSILKQYRNDDQFLEGEIIS